MGVVIRQIAESAKATSVLLGLEQRHERFEDLWLAWSWRLAREPLTDAIPIPGTDPAIYLLRTSPNFSGVGLPFTITFMYSVSADQIDLIDIRYEEVAVPDR